MATKRVVALGLCSVAILAMTPLGCLPEPVTVASSSEATDIPPITVERLRGCFEDYAEQLGAQSYGVQAKVQVDEEGRTVGVVVDGLPLTAPDLAACMRVALQDMAVPGRVLRLRPTEAPVSQQPSVPARGMMGNVLVLGGAVALGKLVLQTAGIMLTLAVVVDLVRVGIEAISQAARNKCLKQLNECLVDRPQ